MMQPRFLQRGVTTGQKTFMGGTTWWGDACTGAPLMMNSSDLKNGQMGSGPKVCKAYNIYEYEYRNINEGGYRR